jgi:hypothetical protein
MKILIKVAAICLALTGCAIGNTVDYRAPVPELAASTAKTVAVTVYDQRPYVLAGSNTPQWVGMIRGGFGNPFGVHTASGDPFAADMAVAIAAGLQAKGVKAVVASGYGQATADRTLRVAVKDWRSDTMLRTQILYDLRADVLDSSGAVLASETAKSETIFSTMGDMPDTTLGKVRKHFHLVVANLINSGPVLAALR